MNKSEITQKINELRVRIDFDDDVTNVRLTIADLVGDALRFFDGSTNQWELSLIDGAIGLVESNFKSPQVDTKMNLKLALKQIEVALTPEDERNEVYTGLPNKQIEHNFDEMIKRFQRMGGLY
jgi:hypothetical protein